MSDQIEYKKIIVGLTKEQICEVCNNLNNWEWDLRLGEQPENWDTIPDFMFNNKYTLPTKRKIISPILELIKTIITEKEIMRWHHLNNRGRSNKEFEFWWFKRSISKFFGIGFYSPKMKKAMQQVLMGVAEKNHEDWVEERFSKK